MLLAVQHFDLVSLLNSTVSLVAAFFLGGLIGLERQYRQRTAGLRTNVLVAVGSALFVDLAFRLHAIYGGTPGGLHVLAYVVSGVGFLGAGVIMREEGNVRGINTAATLWGSAAVGAAAGADMLAEAILGTILVLSANTLLRPVVNRINRAPIDTPDVEVTNTFYVIALKERQAEVLASVEQVLEKAQYPFGISRSRLLESERSKWKRCCWPLRWTARNWIGWPPASGSCPMYRRRSGARAWPSERLRRIRTTPAWCCRAVRRRWCRHFSPRCPPRSVGPTARRCCQDRRADDQ